MDSFRDKFSMVQSLEIDKKPHVWMTWAFYSSFPSPKKFPWPEGNLHCSRLEC